MAKTKIDAPKVKRLALEVSQRFESEHFTMHEVHAALECLVFLAQVQNNDVTLNDDGRLSHGPGCTCFQSDTEKDIQ